jgi:glutathione S-transferase
MLELIQFRHSPYNEKLRWALDLKQVPHRRTSVLPGPHMLQVKKLTTRSLTPVLRRDDGSCMDGSAEMLAWLDAQVHEPPLLPAEPGQTTEALRIQRWFDEDLTPRIRRAVLDALVRSPLAFAGVFADGRPLLARLAYALVLPLAAPLIRQGNGIHGPAAVADGEAALRQALDFVAERSRATGYLAGPRFSIADLTAAATLAVLAQPADSSMAATRPVGRHFAALQARHAAHPGMAWTREIYARHRPHGPDFEGNSHHRPR